MGWIVLIAIVLLIILAFIAVDAKEIAAEKGFVSNKYFWYTLLFGIFGLLLVCALPDRKQSVIKTQEETVNTEELPEL